mmetsp:Transcript_11175/g.19152  ORF Transcript_11175/g.19152 Transcript_11175/m.19152 type:complete len:257 (-) Transcript_11175:15-785(-)
MASAAAAAVAVRHARERQAPAKENLDDMVDASTRALQEQTVLVLNFGRCEVDARCDEQGELGGKKLKVKVRMNDKTHLKSKAQSLVAHSDAPQHIIFDSIGSTIYEGGGDLHFGLCSPQRLWGSSQVLAGCQVPLANVLAFSEAGPCHLELSAPGSPGKVLAHLIIDISARSSPLKAAGGPEALRTTVVPKKPTSYSVFAFDDYAEECMTYTRVAMEAQKRLQDAFDSCHTSRLVVGVVLPGLSRQGSMQPFGTYV